jgi:hypothetical protein
MQFTLTKQLRGYQPLHCDDRGVILLCRGSVYRANHDLTHRRLICSLPPERALVERSRWRFLLRVLRISAQAALLLGDDLYIVRRSRIWRVSLTRGEVNLDFEVPQDRRILSLSKLVAGGESFLCFGEYFFNPTKAPVRLWQRSTHLNAKWHSPYQFPVGEINHVHNIHQSRDGAIYILTGDFGNGSAIWLTTASLDRVALLAGGAQVYRACWLADGDGALYYATDSQLETNWVLKLELQPAPPRATPVRLIEGSSIYSGTCGGNTVFSSTVEPGEPSGNLIFDLFDRRRGPGIRSDYAVIYSLDGRGRVTELFRAVKDFYPPRLAQFGTFMFPSGQMPPGRLYAYGVALRGFDDCCLCFEATDAEFIQS